MSARRRQAIVISGPTVEAIDAAGDRLARRLRGNAVADRVLYGLSQAGNHSALWHGINAVDALLGDPVRRRRALRRSIVLATEQALVNGPVKALFQRKRPIALELHPHELRVPRTSSFPSGHASAGACAARQLSRDVGSAPLWWALAAGVAWSRVHVGVHHLSDVAAGATLGVAFADATRSIGPFRPIETV